MTKTNESLIEKMKIHHEMIAALLSGVLILVAWILSKNIGETTLVVVLYLAAFIIGGFAKAKEGIEETIKEKTLNVELLMILAAIGSAIIGYWTEGAILIFIFAVSGAMETYAMNKSHKEISALMDLQPEVANLLLEDGTTKRVQVSELQVGDRLFIKPGERVPTDGVVVEGISTIDESAITG